MTLRWTRCSILALAALAGATAAAQGRESPAFAREMNALAETWHPRCSNSYDWKDEGASCQQWIEAIDSAASRPQASTDDQHAAAYHRMFARRIYAEGLLHHARKPRRALEQYNEAFADMRSLLEAGQRSALLNGYEVLTGLARALHDTGDTGNSDLMYQQARTLTLQIGQRLAQGADPLPAAHRSRFTAILTEGEWAESRWAEQLSERAAQRALAGDTATAGALWADAAKAYAQAATNLDLAIRPMAPNARWPAQIHPFLRMAGYHRHAGDQWLLSRGAGHSGNSLDLARASYRHSQAQIQRVEEKLAESQPQLGYAGEHLQGSQIGLAEVLAQEGKLKEAVNRPGSSRHLRASN